MSIQERVHARTRPEDVAIDLERRQAGLGAGAGSCTRDRVGWYAFEAFAEAGRSLYVLVVVGKRAPAWERADLKRLLASLHFSPAAQPLPSFKARSGSARIQPRRALPPTPDADPAPALPRRKVS
jgi:hypothetical protein